MKMLSGAWLDMGSGLKIYELKSVALAFWCFFLELQWRWHSVEFGWSVIAAEMYIPSTWNDVDSTVLFRTFGNYFNWTTFDIQYPYPRWLNVIIPQRERARVKRQDIGWHKQTNLKTTTETRNWIIPPTVALLCFGSRINIQTQSTAREDQAPDGWKTCLQMAQQGSSLSLLSLSLCSCAPENASKIVVTVRPPACACVESLSEMIVEQLKASDASDFVCGKASSLPTV